MAAAQRHRERDLVLDAMVDSVGRRGFQATSVARVCAQAEMPRKTFYDLFAGKEAVALAAFDRAVLHLRDVVDAAYAQQGTARERVQWAMEVVLEWGANDPALARFCLIEVPAISPIGRERRIDAAEWLVLRLEAALAGFSVSPLLPEMMIGGIQELIMRRALAGATNTLPDLVPTLVNGWLGGLEELPHHRLA